MGRQAAVVLYVLALVAVVVGVDVLFFRHHFWERLIAPGLPVFAEPAASCRGVRAVTITEMRVRAIGMALPSAARSHV